MGSDHDKVDAVIRATATKPKSALEVVGNFLNVVGLPGATLGLVALVVYLLVIGFPDRWTGSDHHTYATMQDQRIEHVNDNIDALRKVVEAHVATPHHIDAGLRITRLEASMEALLRDVTWIRTTLETR